MTFGYVLPMTHINHECVEYRVPEGEEPLVTLTGVAARRFHLNYDYEAVSDEPENFN